MSATSPASPHSVSSMSAGRRATLIVWFVGLAVLVGLTVWYGAGQVGRAVVDAGKVRRLAVTSAVRFPGLPELPSLSETVPGVVMNGWFAVVTPAGTPADVVQKLNRDIDRFLEGKEIQQRLLTFGLATDGAGTPESTARFIAQEQKNWLALAKELNVEAQ